MQQINVSALVPSAHNVRTQNDTDEHLQLLATNIAQHGLLHPPTVRAVGNGTYEIIAGLRRVQAAKLLGWTTIPCTVLTAPVNDMFQVSFAENMQRRNMKKRDICRAIERYITQAAGGQADLQGVATLMQLTLPTVRRYALIAQLDDATLDRLDATDDTYLTLYDAETMARAVANPPAYTAAIDAESTASDSIVSSANPNDSQTDSSVGSVGSVAGVEGPPDGASNKKPRKKPTKSEPWIYSADNAPLPIPPHLYAPILHLVTSATMTS